MHAVADWEKIRVTGVVVQLSTTNLRNDKTCREGKVSAAVQSTTQSAKPHTSANSVLGSPQLLTNEMSNAVYRMGVHLTNVYQYFLCM